MAIIIIIYLLANVVFILTLSVASMAQSDLVASESAFVYLGQRGTVFVALAIIVAILGANNGCVLAGARLAYAMARAGVFFKWAGKVHPKYETPALALIFQAVWAIAFTLTGTFEQLITYVVFVSWIFYALSCGGVFILRRRRPEIKRPYQAWGYPVVPAIFIIFALWLTGAGIVSAPRDTLIGTVIVLAGLPAYYLWRRKGLSINGTEER
ncbi:MAG: amino acid permease, partial [Candidatus Neomarinimicrobiota bacterium]